MAKKIKLYGKSRTVPVLKTDLGVLSWLLRGKMRKEVFMIVNDKTMPSQVVKQLAGKGRKSSNIYIQTSRALAELEVEGLIKCLNPKEKTGRFYSVTKLGKKIKKEIDGVGK